MKISIASILLIFITFYSCENMAQYDDAEVYSQSNKSAQVMKSEVIYKDVISPKTNKANVSIPIPSSWNVHNPQQYDQPYITAPDRTTVTVYTPHDYYYNLNSQQAQFFTQSGKRVMNPISLQNYFKNYIQPTISSKGASIIKSYTPEDILNKKEQADKIAAEAHRLNVSGGEILVVEIENADNSNSLLYIQKTVASMQNMHFWNVIIEELNSPKKSFANAKKYYINSLLNSRMNIQEIHASAEIMRQQSQKQRAQNRAYYQSMSQQSYQAHQSRMRANEAAFQKTQQIHTSTSNAISDMSMQGWRNRNASSDYMQQQSVNAIHNENTVTNPHTSQSGQVQSGYKYYYINSNGQYIGTNDAFYNPSQDPNIGHQNWKKVGN